ncbi:hypothetical protein [Gelidibacter mesophilus]|uniref:hypothetical protein n=1 Tax=Gelidibacter mesophilus TaxID=169050 RepID=UPI00040C16DE|nr:hypothetical protein [Gelidibacter mesophilus]
MKKVVLTAAIILGGLSTYATTEFSPNQTEGIDITVQEEYKEIKAETLPKAVKDALAKDFPSATLDKAYVKEVKQVEYKLEITVDGAAATVYADKDGNWIKKE